MLLAKPPQPNGSLSNGASPHHSGRGSKRQIHHKPIQQMIKQRLPLVSVITASYNHARFIAKTLESIAAQDYQSLEYIVIDDGSTDPSAEIIASFEAAFKSRFRRFIFLQQSNSGSVATLNRAVLLSKGEYLFFVASDDIAEPNAISRLLEALEAAPDASLSVPDNSLIDSQGQPCFWTKDRHITYNRDNATYLTFADYLRKRTGNNNFESNWFGSYGALIQSNHIPNGTLVRRSAIERAGLFKKEAPLEDYHMVLQLAKFSRMLFLPEPLLRYRWHDGNTVKNNAHMLRLAIKTIAFEKEYCRSHGHLVAWHARQSRRILELLVFYRMEHFSIDFDVLRTLAIGLPCLMAQRITQLVKRWGRSTKSVE
jgi:alpha-1,3-rhamnosyltransferase